MRGIALLIALALAAPAAGQGAVGSSALRGHDTKAPVDIDAERIEVLDREKRAIFTGSVKVRQARLALDAARMRVSYQTTRGEDLEILRVDADGDVRLVSPSERATARYGIYDVESRQITLIGGVVLNRGGSVLRGERLAIDLDSGRSTLDAGGARGGAPGRVTGRFVVPERRN